MELDDINNEKKKTIEMVITFYTYHDDPLTSPERSTRQLSWVFKGLLLYAPATVKRAA